MEKKADDRSNRFESKQLEDSRKKGDTLRAKREEHRQMLEDKKNESKPKNLL